MNTSLLLTNQEIIFFHENGYLLKRNFVDRKIITNLQVKIINHLKNRVEPYELEQEVNYPGSPKTKTEDGGDTIRRLKQAFMRDRLFKQWAHNDKVCEVLRGLLQSEKLYLVQSHHNCIMTKQPHFSSETHWHKDTRYWNFENNNLINTWLPLGDETADNGCLHVIPKTHLWQTTVEYLDDRLFLRKDLENNQKWIKKAVNVELALGDLLFFHAALFHAAGKNNTDQSKNAVVYTYHSDSNKPIVNTNSVKFKEIQI